MKQKITAILTAITLTVGSFCNTVQAEENIIPSIQTETAKTEQMEQIFTETVFSKEEFLPETSVKADDGDFSTAIPITMGNAFNGSITETTEEQIYKFTLTESGRITLNLTFYMRYCSLYIYGNDGSEIWKSEHHEWNENLKYSEITKEVDLINGTYYLKVNGRGRYNHMATGTYSAGTKFVSAQESFPESNNDFSQASVISANGTVKGQIAENDDYDVYKFSLAKAGRMNLTVTFYLAYNSIYLYDSAGREIWKSEHHEWNQNLKYKINEYTLDLAGGNYYLKISGEGKYRRFDTGNYTFTTNYTNADINYKEPNNDFAEACTIQTNTTVKGQIAIDDHYDILKFSLFSEGSIKIVMTYYMKYYTLILYDNAGEEIWHTDHNEWNANAGYREDEHTVTLSAGTYYVKVTGYYYGASYDSTGTYRLKINTKTSLADTFVSSPGSKAYTGKEIRPSVTVTYHDISLKNGTDYSLSYQNNKKIGKADIVITGKGNYIGIKKVSFKIVPKKVSITKGSNSSRRTVTLKWKKDRSVTGYEVYRSLNKNTGYKKVKTISKNRITSFKNTKLSRGRTYFYKIRAYKIVKSKKYYGSYSKVKSIKIRK